MLLPLQVSSLAREHEQDSYRMSWDMENLDNIALSSSPAHSGYEKLLFKSHIQTLKLFVFTVNMESKSTFFIHVTGLIVND